jgi:hypothetical protein
MKKVRNHMKYADGTAMPYEVVLGKVVDKINRASKLGEGLRLSAEEVRALDWCVIREDGGVENVDQFREGSFEEIGDV